MKDFESEKYLGPPQGLLDPDSSHFIQNINILEDKAMTDRIEQLESARELDQQLIEKLLDENRKLKQDNENLKNPLSVREDTRFSADAEKAKLQDSENIAERTVLDERYMPSLSGQQRETYQEEVNQQKKNQSINNDIVEAIDASNLSDENKLRAKELLAIRDTPEIRLEIDRTNRIAQSIYEAADFDSLSIEKQIVERAEGRMRTAMLEKDIAASSLSDEHKIEVAETLNHLTNAALGHEPRPFAPDFKAPAEPPANRQTRIASIVEQYKPIRESEIVKEKESASEPLNPQRPKL